MSKNEGASKVTVYTYDPMALAIMGGLDALPERERGPLDTKTDKSHPLYDERLKLKLTPEWVENIKTRGVMEHPTIVMIDKVPFVVNGRQRIRAARVANLQLAEESKPTMGVTCSLVKVDELGMLSDMVSLNIHTEDSTVTKIAKLKRLMARGVDVEGAAVLFATRPATIKAYLQYDELATPEVKKAVASGKIPQTTGADIARLPEDKQAKALQGVLKGTTPNTTGKSERKGNASKAKRAIRRAVGKTASLSDKKSIRRFLAAVEAQEHPKNTSGPMLMWWQGIEAALHFVLGSDGADAKLVAILDALDGVESSTEDGAVGVDSDEE